MTTGVNTRARHKAHAAIEHALRAYHGADWYEELPDGVNGGNCHEMLRRKHVTQAVTALTMYLGTCGSVGKVDLYMLMNAVLLDPEKNAELARLLEDGNTIEK